LLIAIPFANMYRLSKRGLLWVADISETDLEYVQKTSVAAVTCLLLLFVEVKVIFKVTGISLPARAPKSE